MKPSPAQSSTPKLTLELIIIASGVVALSQGANGIIVPAMPKFIASLGGSSVILGLAISLFSIARLATNVPAGLLTERLGRKRVLVAGALITALFSTLSGTAPNVPTLLVYRALVGLGSAATITAGTVAVTDLSSVSNRGRALSVLQAWQLISGVASPGIGGFVAASWGLRAPFYVSGVGVLLVTLWAVIRLPETKGLAQARGEALGKSAGGLKDALALLSRVDFLLVCFVAFSIFFTRFGATQSLVPLKAYQDIKWDPRSVGLMFSAAAALNIVLVAPSAYISDRFGRKAAIVPSGIVAATGLALIAFSSSATVFAIAFIVFNAGTALGGPAPAAYVGDIASGRQRGLSIGIYRMFGDLGGAVGPLATTGIAGHATFLAGFLLTSGLMFTSCALFALFAKETAGRKVRDAAQAAEKPV